MQAFPIKNLEIVNEMSEYIRQNYPPKIYVLWLTGLNTGLRVSDILKLKWTDIFTKDGDFCYYTYQRASKTKKPNHIYTSPKLKTMYNYLRDLYPDDVFVFQSNAFTFRNLADGSRRVCKKDHPIMYKRQTKAMREEPRPYSYQYINNVMKETAKALGLKFPVSTHTMRKTFAWVNCYVYGHEISIISEILQHSNLTVTKRYLCIDEDEKSNILETSDIGFLPELSDVSVMPDISKQHLSEIRSLVLKLALNPKLENFYIENLCRIFKTIWEDPKKRKDYVQRIVKAQFYLAKRVARVQDSEDEKEK